MKHFLLFPSSKFYVRKGVRQDWNDEIMKMRRKITNFIRFSDDTISISANTNEMEKLLNQYAI